MNLPSLGDWHLWAGLAAVVAFVATEPSVWSVLSRLRLPPLNLGTSKAPTAAQAFAAVELLATYKLNAKDKDPAYNAVLAAWKSEAPA